MLGHTQPLLLLAPFPSTMSPLRRRIEEAGYSFLDSAEVPAALSSMIAFLPFNIQFELEHLRSVLRRALDTYPGLIVVGANLGRLRFTPNLAYEAGLKFMYALPFEEELLINKLFELLPPEIDGKDLSLDHFMRVSVVEIDRAPSLPFNMYLYLPANRKVIHYYQKGSAIDEKRVQKFKENAHYNLYIRRTELSAYKQYCAYVVAGGGARGEAAAHNQDRRESGERLMGLMADFFNDDALSDPEAQMSLENLKDVVEQLETPGTPKELMGEVRQIVAQQMTYVSHAQNVAAYCCLFGLTLNAADATTLKLGGLLHDLGLADFPPHLIGRDLDQMEEKDAAKYKLHPGTGKITIQDRKIKVPPEVMDMILYHHERPDGSGYPYGRTSTEIPLVAKVCAFADEFDKLTSVRVGHRQLSPADAVKRIAGLDGEKPMAVYDQAVHQPLVDLLLKSKPSAPRGDAAEESVRGAKMSEGLPVARLLQNAKLCSPRSAGITRESPEYVSLWRELEDHWARQAAT